MILVVGASGYLGSLICKELMVTGQPVRAMVRNTLQTEYLKHLGVETVVADLNVPASLPEALAGCTAVIYTATAAFPSRRGENVRGDKRRAQAMIDAARLAGVSKFVFISALRPVRAYSAFTRAKAEIEEYLVKSGLDYTILRCGLFMEVWLALMGSSIPVTPVEPGLKPTLERPFPFARRFFHSNRHSIDRNSLARINGSGITKVSWIASADVARIAVASLGEPVWSRNIVDLPGVTLSWLDTAAVFERVLKRPLQVSRMPIFLLRLLGGLVWLFISRAGGDLLLASVAASVEDMEPDGYQFRRVMPKFDFQSPEQFLRQRLDMSQKKLLHAG